MDDAFARFQADLANVPGGGGPPRLPPPMAPPPGYGGPPPGRLPPPAAPPPPLAGGYGGPPGAPQGQQVYMAPPQPAAAYQHYQQPAMVAAPAAPYIPPPAQPPPPPPPQHHHLQGGYGGGMPQQQQQYQQGRAGTSGLVAAAKAAASGGAKDGEKDKEKPKTGPVREKGGKRWRDPTLDEWPKNDHRIFVGNIGNDVTDEMLAKAFQKYPSFAKAKVVKDKRTMKSKVFGFVSFLESADFLKAMKEMDGKYIGNRPCQLKKSTWDDRAPSPPPNKKHKKPRAE